MPQNTNQLDFNQILSGDEPLKHLQNFINEFKDQANQSTDQNQVLNLVNQINDLNVMQSLLSARILQNKQFGFLNTVNNLFDILDNKQIIDGYVNPNLDDVYQAVINQPKYDKKLTHQFHERFKNINPLLYTRLTSKNNPNNWDAVMKAKRDSWNYVMMVKKDLYKMSDFLALFHTYDENLKGFQIIELMKHIDLQTYITPPETKLMKSFNVQSYFNYPDNCFQKRLIDKKLVFDNNELKKYHDGLQTYFKLQQLPNLVRQLTLDWWANHTPKSLNHKRELLRIMYLNDLIYPHQYYQYQEAFGFVTQPILRPVHHYLKPETWQWCKPAQILNHFTRYQPLAPEFDRRDEDELAILSHEKHA